MMLITIDDHPLRSDAFDKFLAGMAIEADCRAAIHRADYVQNRNYDGSTTMDRLQALHDHMDALNAHYDELRQAGRLKEPTTPVSDQARCLKTFAAPSA